MAWHHIEDREVKARKQHRCTLCGLRIRKGAKYIRRRGVDGPEHITMKMHAVCEDATSWWGVGDWESMGDEADFREFSLGMNRHPIGV